MHLKCILSKFQVHSTVLLIMLNALSLKHLRSITGDHLLQKVLSLLDMLLCYPYSTWFFLYSRTCIIGEPRAIRGLFSFL